MMTIPLYREGIECGSIDVPDDVMRAARVVSAYLASLPAGTQLLGVGMVDYSDTARLDWLADEFMHQCQRGYHYVGDGFDGQVGERGDTVRQAIDRERAKP